MAETIICWPGRMVGSSICESMLSESVVPAVKMISSAFAPMYAAIRSLARSVAEVDF